MTGYRFDDRREWEVSVATVSSVADARRANDVDVKYSPSQTSLLARTIVLLDFRVSRLCTVSTTSRHLFAHRYQHQYHLHINALDCSSVESTLDS